MASRGNSQKYSVMRSIDTDWKKANRWTASNHKPSLSLYITQIAMANNYCIRDTQNLSFYVSKTNWMKLGNDQKHSNAWESMVNYWQIEFWKGLKSQKPGMMKSNLSGDRELNIVSMVNYFWITNNARTPSMFCCRALKLYIFVWLAACSMPTTVRHCNSKSIMVTW